MGEEAFNFDYSNINTNVDIDTLLNELSAYQEDIDDNQLEALYKEYEKKNTPIGDETSEEEKPHAFCGRTEIEQNEYLITRKEAFKPTCLEPSIISAAYENVNAMLPLPIILEDTQYPIAYMTYISKDLKKYTFTLEVNSKLKLYYDDPTALEMDMLLLITPQQKEAFKLRYCNAKDHEFGQNRLRPWTQLQVYIAKKNVWIYFNNLLPPPLRCNYSAMIAVERGKKISPIVNTVDLSITVPPQLPKEETNPEDMPDKDDMAVLINDLNSIMEYGDITTNDIREIIVSELANM